jgi:hypothetical protein
MDPHHRMAVLLVPQRQMGKGAERTIAHEDVAALSDGMHLAHMGHVVRVARRGHNLEQEACARMKQGKEMPDRKPPPRLLPWRIAAGGVQLRGIGHGKTGPIDQEGPVAVPAAFLLGHLIQGATDPSPHLLPDRQRKPAAGLAKGRRSKLLPGSVGEMATGRVPVQDLEATELDGGHRIEETLAPRVAHLTAQGQDRGGIEEVCEFSMDLP